MLSEKAIKNLRKVWLVAEQEYKVEVNGHLRENDIPVILKLGQRKEVAPDCDIAYKYITFHTHPQIDLDYEDRLVYGRMLPTIISGPDIAQLFSCNLQERPVTRTELVLGEFGVVEAKTTQESIDFYTTLNPEHRVLFENLIEMNGYLHGDLFQFGIIPPKRLKYQLEHIDNSILTRIMADQEDMQVIKDNAETLGESLRLYLDALAALSSHVTLPSTSFKLIDLTYYWFDPSIRDDKMY